MTNYNILLTLLKGNNKCQCYLSPYMCEIHFKQRKCLRTHKPISVTRIFLNLYINQISKLEMLHCHNDREWTRDPTKHLFPNQYHSLIKPHLQSGCVEALHKPQLIPPENHLPMLPLMFCFKIYRQSFK